MTDFQLRITNWLYTNLQTTKVQKRNPDNYRDFGINFY